MAKPAGHKANCKCVACSPATRKRGQAALAASRGTAKPRKNPAAGGTRRTSVAKPKRARKNPAPQVVVVHAPAAPAPAKRRTRKNPAAPKKASTRASSTRARKNPEAPRRAHPHLPTVTAGEYLVLCTEPGDGGRLRPVKTFSRISDATAFARELPSGSKAVVTEARSTWG